MKDIIFEATGMRKNFWVTPQTAELHAEEAARTICDYVGLSGTKGVVIGMSGGLDSAVTGAACAYAGVDVHAVLLPCGSSMLASGSRARAIEVCDKFGFEMSQCNIEPSRNALRSNPASLNEVPPEYAYLANMNLQARLRVAKLREIAQLENRLVIGTDNLTELMLGYFTKDGNGCDLRPFALFTKRELYHIAPLYAVPESIIRAIPSAELFPGQTDEEELGFTYHAADDFLEFGTCYDDATDAKILRAIRASQHKRTPPPFYQG